LRDLREAIRDRIDLVELVSDYVRLERAGRNFKGLCPFHTEKTPSFHVSPALNRFHCFGCGASGDAFDLPDAHRGAIVPRGDAPLGGTRGD
jgi:DNA primase